MTNHPHSAPTTDAPQARAWTQKQAQSDQFLEMRAGDFGAFFSSTSVDCIGYASLFPRLQKLLQSKKHDWSAALPVCTNYFRAVCNIITDFSLGEGVRLAFTSPTKASDEFADWWQTEQLDHVIAEALSCAIAAGVSGVQLHWNNSGTLSAKGFTLGEYFPAGDPVWGWNHAQPTLAWQIGHEGEKVQYQIVFAPDESGQIVAMAEVRNINADGSIGQLVTGAQPTVAEEYSRLPVALMHSPRRGPDGFGQSFFSDILSQVQTICFLDTMASIELQTHFLSKLAVPRSVVTTDKNGTPHVGALEYIVFEDDGQIPQFIQKDNKFFEDLIRHTQTMKESIALSTGVPFELLSKDGKTGDEKATLAEIRQRPFRQVVRAWQRVARGLVDEIYGIWHQNTHPQKERAQLQIILPDGFTDTSTEARASLLAEFQAGLISHRRYIKLTNPDLAEAEVDAVVAESKMGKMTVSERFETPPLDVPETTQKSQ